MLGLCKNIGLTFLEVSSAVRSLGSYLVGECVSARGQKDTFERQNLCEVDINEGLVDGRVEGRTGVHVESEVVLKCEGYNKESACDMLC